MRRLVVLLAVAACSSCSPLRHIGIGLDGVQAMIRRIDCHDGAPAKILIDPHCPQGVCGITCAPDRWWP